MVKACLHAVPSTHSSNLLVVHTKRARAPAIYSTFHSHTCTDFPTPALHGGTFRVASMPQHVRSPQGFGDAEVHASQDGRITSSTAACTTGPSLTSDRAPAKPMHRTHATKNRQHTPHGESFVPISTTSMCAVYTPLHLQKLTFNILQSLFVYLY